MSVLEEFFWVYTAIICCSQLNAHQFFIKCWSYLCQLFCVYLNFFKEEIFLWIWHSHVHAAIFWQLSAEEMKEQINRVKNFTGLAFRN